MVVDKCKTASCAQSVRLLRYAGHNKWPTDDLSHYIFGVVYATDPVEWPFMRVGMYSDYITAYAGFTANWWTSGSLPNCYCLAGTYTGTASCQNCPPHSISPADSLAITACTCNAGWNGADGDTCVGCAADTFKAVTGDSGCVGCPANSGSPAKSSACICNAGWSGTHANCTDCASGKYKPSAGPEECSPCGTGASSNAAAEACTCNAGWYSEHVRSECLLCVNAYSVADSVNRTSCVCNAGWTGTDNDCNACVAGKYKANTGSGACSGCAPGKFSVHVNSTSNTCIDCIAGSYSSATKSYCVACVTGKYKDITWSIACTDCGAGKYSDVLHAATDTCRECAAGLYSYHDRSKCVSCPANSYSETQSDAIASCSCNAGWSGQNGDCLACVPGKYKTSSANVACTVCGAGKYSDVVNASTDTCRACAAAFYSYHDRSKCVPCSVNSYSPAQSDSISSCICNAGWSGQKGVCTACVPGKYKTNSAIHACTVCGAGKYSDVVNASTDTCRACAAAFYSYHDRSKCVPCSVNSYSPAQSNSIASCICNAGWSGQNGDCLACVPGKYKTSSGNVVCTECGAAKYSDVLNASTDTCSECTAGLYPHHDRSKCVSCPANSYAAAQGDTIALCSCNAGWSGQNADCTACVSGKYKAIRGSASCNVCRTDTYERTLIKAIVNPVCSSVKPGTYLEDGSKQYGGGQVYINSLNGPYAYLWKPIDQTTPQIPADQSTSRYFISYFNVGVNSIMAYVFWDGISIADSIDGWVYCMGSASWTSAPGIMSVSIYGEPCSQCPVHSTSPDGTMSVTACICTAGYYSNDRKNECLLCPQNSYTLVQTGSISDCSCNAGWYGTNVNCQACASGKYKDSLGSAECTACGHGKFATPSRSSCSLCGPGKYVVDASADECRECTAGFYSADDRSQCLSCPANSYSEPQSGEITSCFCNAGWTGVNGNCIACATGKYKETTGSEPCGICQPDTFEKTKLKITSRNANCQTAMHGTFLDHNHEKYGGSQIYILKNNLFSSTVYLWKSLYSNYWIFGDAVGADTGYGYFIWNGEEITSSINGWAWCGGYFSVTTSMVSISTDGGPCSLCPLNSKSPGGSKPLSSCLCKAGWTGANTNCIGCVAGKYKANIGYEVCSGCAAGKSSPYVTAVTDTCVICIAGSYSNDPKKCVSLMSTKFTLVCPE